MVEGATVAKDDDFFVAEAARIFAESEKLGLVLRLMGALAIGFRSSHYAQLHRRLGRLGQGASSFSDMDYMAYGKQSNDIVKFFEKLEFVPDRYALLYYGSKRLIFYHRENYYHIDVFFDKLEFSHDIDFGKEPGKGRLELDKPTVALSDLTLEKLQINQISEKDIKDVIVLFVAHELGEMDDREVIDVKRIVQVLAEDWGFWYDATENLRKVLHFAANYNTAGLLSDVEYHAVNSKVSFLLARIDSEPKSKKWQQRARKGNKEKWFRDVEEFFR